MFLDAGGVLVNPNWSRVSETLARHGVARYGRRCSRRRSRARSSGSIRGETIQGDQRRAARVDLLQPRPDRGGRPADRDATAAALAELNAYHQAVQPVGNGARRGPAGAGGAARARPPARRRLQRQRHAASRMFDAARTDRGVRRHLRLARRRRREAGSAFLSDRAGAVGRATRRPRSTSATSITSTSWAPVRPALPPSCSTRGICIGIRLPARPLTIWGSTSMLRSRGQALRPAYVAAADTHRVVRCEDLHACWSVCAAVCDDRLGAVPLDARTDPWTVIFEGARLLRPGSGPPIERGTLLVENGRIVRIGETAGRREGAGGRDGESISRARR